MHVQVDGIEFNHRNDRPFFFFGGGATWMVCGDKGLDDWCPARKWQRICGGRWKKSCLVINSSVWRIQESPYFPRISPLLILFTTWFPFEGHMRHRSSSSNVAIYHTFLSSVVDSVVGSDTWVKPTRAAGDAASPASEVKSNMHFKILFPSFCPETLDERQGSFLSVQTVFNGFNDFV